MRVNNAEGAAYLVREGFHLYSPFAQRGFHLYNRLIVIRHYDDVLAEEYDEYQEYMQHEKRLQLMRQGLEDVAPPTAHCNNSRTWRWASPRT